MALGTLDWIEEPIRDESPEAYEEVQAQATTQQKINAGILSLVCERR